MDCSSLRVSEGGCHCDPAVALTIRDMTEKSKANQSFITSLEPRNKTWMMRLWQHLSNETDEEQTLRHKGVLLTTT